MKVLAWPAPSHSLGNPYIGLVYREFPNEGLHIEPYSIWAIRRPRADVFHVHWPEAILWGRIASSVPFATKLAAERVLDTMALIRGNGGSVVWTVHNIAPHGISRRRDERVWEVFFPKFRENVDALIGLTSRSLDLVCDAYPELRGRPRTVVPHPHYRTAYPAAPSIAEARAAVGLPLDHFIVAMVGIIRRSKGVPRAIEAFRRVRRRNESLLVSGHCEDAELAAEIRTAIGNDASVVFENRHLPASELVCRFAAADVILINQRDTLNSGTLLLALSMNRPAVAPAGGSIRELAGSMGPDWICPFSDELTPAALRECVDAIQRHERRRQAPLDRFDPATVSRAMVAALRHALTKRPDANIAS
jgi:beta-1,4-mannosyltransferase